MGCIIVMERQSANGNWHIRRITGGDVSPTNEPHHSAHPATTRLHRGDPWNCTRST
jgi:hypothetical protein